MKTENEVSIEERAKDPAWNRYHKTFYGTEIPASLREKIAVPFVKMVDVMTQDVREVYPDIDKECTHRAILAGLSKMCDMGVDYMHGYLNEVHVKKEVFKTMTGVVSRFKEQQRLESALHQEREEREAQPVVVENPKTKKLLDEFDTSYDYWYRQGLDRYEANVRAFTDLCRDNQVIEGVEHYVFFKLPMEKEIRNDERVIAAMNANPSLRSDFKPVRMLLNDRSWKGLGGTTP